MLIIVEGPDCAGKTTFVQDVTKALILRDFQVTRYHASVPRLDVVDEYIAPLVDYAPNARDSVVCDRWHWGERVYPYVFGRPNTTMTMAKWWYIEEFLRTRGALVVHVNESSDVIRKRYAARGDTMVSEAQLRDQVGLYNVVYCGLTSLPKITYTPSMRHLGASDPDDKEGLLDLAQSISRARGRTLWIARGRAGYIGPDKPKRVFVVPRPKNMLSREFSLVIPRLYPQLLEAVYRTKADPRRYGFIVDTDLSTQVDNDNVVWKSVYDDLGRPEIAMVSNTVNWSYMPPLAFSTHRFAHVFSPAAALYRELHTDAYRSHLVKEWP